MDKTVLFRISLEEIDLVGKLREFYSNQPHIITTSREAVWTASQLKAQFKDSLSSFEFVIYDTYEAEVICNNETLIKELTVLPATREEVSNYLEVNGGTPTDYDFFRSIFSKVKPNPIDFEVERDGNQFFLYYKHTKFFDMNKHLDKYTISNDSEYLSGLRRNLQTDDTKELAERTALTCKDIGDNVTEVIIDADGINTYFGHTSNTVTVKDVFDLDDLEELIYDEYVDYEDDEDMIRHIIIMLNEFILNAVYHDGMCEWVKISQLLINDKKYFLFNYSDTPTSIQGF